MKSPITHKLFTCVVLACFGTLLTVAQDFKVQHLQADVSNNGGSSSITSVSSLNNAFVLSNNNRKANGGRSDQSANDLNGDDLSGAVRLTNASTVSFYRESGSNSANMKFSTSIWEYTGAAGGENEFIVRGRYIVHLNGTNNSTSQTISGISNQNKCIPFITGILNNDSSQGADSGTAIAYLESASSLRVEKGSNANNVSVYITLVEFTGSNWSVLHGDSGNKTNDTGSITLRGNSNGSTGSPASVSNWDEALIFTHHKGYGSDNGTDQAIADNWPLIVPGSDNKSVDWEFDSNHDAQNNGNRHFVHVLNHSSLKVSRFTNTNSNSGENTIDISAANLSSVDQGIIVGTSISSGTGTAYGRGWRNYYFNSNTQIAHWSHRSGNTTKHAIQVADLSEITSSTDYCESYGNGPGYGLELISLNNWWSDVNPYTGYEEHSGETTTLEAGNTYEIATYLAAPTSDHYHIRVWFDWNQDGDFDDDGEEYYLGSLNNNWWSNSSNSPLDITVPMDAVPGTTGMRISSKRNDQYFGPCETGFTGTVDDYEITIVGSTIDPESSYCESYGNGSGYGLDAMAFNTIWWSDTDPYTAYAEHTGPDNTTSLDVGSTYQLETYIRAPYSQYVHVRTWIDWNQDGDFDDNGEEYYLGSLNNSYWDLSSNAPLNITVPADAVPGNTGMRISAKRNDQYFGPCETGFTGTVDDYIISIVGSVQEPEIDVSGNGNTISNGDNTPSSLDGTNFGTVNIGQSQTQTFTIQNTGTSDLTINNISLSNTSNFTLIGTTYPLTISAGNSSSFQIEFSSTTSGLHTAQVTIESNDTDESTFTFQIEGTIIQDFYDSDGDGVFDDVDIDDDNDGIQDSEEELSCKNSSISTYVNYKFLNETFGTGTNRATINITYDAQTSYCYEDGSGSCNSNQDLNDGEYTVYHKACDGDGVNDTPNNEVASWADEHWYSGLDHTTGDTNGRMAMFNASYDPGLFYTAHIKGALPNVPITYSFWVINLDNHDAPGISTRLRPDILVEFRDENGNLLNSLTTGSIPPNNPASANEGWINFSADLTFSVDEFYVYFFNNETGGLGNDLALDDIVISQTLCDTDGDGVADVFDLDSDNDGIPDVVEAGLGQYSQGSATLTNAPTWVDANGNGMHDLAEGHITLDSDNDGTPNYLDLDSDNDAIFDVDESGAGNLNNLSFQNGDGDINGDGVGDGTDSDDIRLTDIDSDGIVEYFSDGILDLYDYANGSTFSSAYGNNNQGTGYTYYVADSDNDGIPDYIDLDSNNDGVFDISGTLYASLDANNDGIIDDTNDSDSDGLLDLFDTNDNLFGSPRDLNQKLHLYFDGRNDYAEDTQLLNGLSNASFMAWIKIDPSFTGRAIILGQANFELELENYGDVTITAHADNKQFSTGDIPLNQWVHVAATTSSSTNQMVLYINGENRGSVNGLGGSLNSNSFNFTLGKSADPSDSNTYYKGYMDEVRIFTKTLSDDEIHKMVYQEIKNYSGNVRGEIIPRDITNFVDIDDNSALSWSTLLRYFRMDVYKDDVIDDLTTTGFDTGSGARIYNVKHIDYQTAPLPFVTQHGDDLLPETLDIPEDGVNGFDATTYDWSIVKVLHNNISYNDNESHLAFILEENDSSNTPIKFNVENDSELNISWYLKLDGLLDLTGESQLVQGLDSELDVTSKGRIEIDQQGTKDLFTYNYWASPVGFINTTTNNMAYKVPDVLFDGTDANNVQEINFIAGYNGNAGSPISIAHYWIWKFNNLPTDDYASWQHVRNTGTMYVGEGYTMKGVTNTSGNVSQEQNYVFIGKPNNGDIELTINNNNDYLVGNPYPSAIDAHQFIIDNGNLIEGNGNLSGTLYFWEHWGGGSHVLADYQGGYATYNLSGGAPSASYGTNDPDVGTGGTPTKIPGRYIPVGQGFFVTGESNGQIKFNNGQRVFRKESNGVSVFVKQASTGTSLTNDDENEDIEDTRLKIRLGYNSVNTIHRQLLVTQDSLATAGIDWGYDGAMNEDQMDDMFWHISNGQFVIQGIDAINETTVLPLGIKTTTQGVNTIMIDALENVPDELNIYLYDSQQNLYHDLRVSHFTTTLEAGEHLNRFELRFSAETLSNQEEILGENLSVYYTNGKQEIIIHNPKLLDIKSMEVFNTLGQSVYRTNEVTKEEYIRIQPNNLSTGTYIISVSTKLNGTINKKIMIK